MMDKRMKKYNIDDLHRQCYKINHEMLKRFREYSKLPKVQANWIRYHSENIHNEQVDKLAKSRCVAE